MSAKVRFIGLDVHKDTIVIAVAKAGDTPAEIWKTIPHDPGRLLRDLKRLGTLANMRVCYEAGPTGFGLQRFLEEHDVECQVVAPSMVPVTSGSRIKTDRRDARNLAHFLRSGNLTPVWVPDEQTEALRDLERARDDARIAERRARQQLLKFLLRHDRRFTEGKHHWTQTHWRWILRQRFELEALNRVLDDYVHAAQQAAERVRRLNGDIAELVEGWALAPLVKNLQALRGVELITGIGLAAEIGNFERFEKAKHFMAFVGLIPSEHSTGTKRRQGPITKTGNRHVRRLLLESAWHYYNAPPGVSAVLQKRREGLSPEVVAIAEKAQRRLRRKAARMKAAGKLPNKIATALARELAGFVWAIARATEPVAAPSKAQDGESPRKGKAAGAAPGRSRRKETPRTGLSPNSRSRKEVPARA